MPFSDELIYEQLTIINSNLEQIKEVLENSYRLPENKRQPQLDASQYVDTKQAAEIIGLSVAFFKQARLKGDGPAYFKLGGAIRYKLADLLAWCDTRKFGHTTQWNFEKRARAKIR